MPGGPESGKEGKGPVAAVCRVLKRSGVVMVFRHMV